MRILHVITLCELGGAQTVVANIANKTSEDHEVVVAVGEGDGKMLEMLNPDIKVERIPSLLRRVSPANDLKTFFALSRLKRRYKPDVVHLHSSKAGVIGRLVFPSRKIVYTVHGFDSIRIAYRKFLPLERMLQNKCAAIVGVSRYDEDNLIFERIRHNVTTIHNGLNRTKPLDSDPFENLGENFKGTVLCIARLAPPKNHELFLKVAKNVPDYRFVWIGNQNPPNFKHPSNVFFLGNLPNAAAYTSFADLFILPTNYEGLPMVIIEALSNGTPVVASAVGGIPEILDGVNGLAVNNDIKVMTRAVRRFLNATPEEKKMRSKAAIHTYEEEFSADKMVDGYMEIYNNIYKSK